MFSQKDEEQYILDFFKDKETGRLLDIGAYHPELFSNSRKLILDGWEAVLVEASPECYETLNKFYKDDSKVSVYNIALNDYDGNMKFFDSTGAVATGSLIHYNKWKDYQKDYREITIPCLSWKTFSDFFTNKTFDFINIDVEGLDWSILNQIDLNETKTELICIEYTYNLKNITEYLAKYGFDLITYNDENILAGRKI